MKRIYLILTILLAGAIIEYGRKPTVSELDRQRAVIADGYRAGHRGESSTPPPYDTEDRVLWIDGYRAGETDLFTEAREHPPKQRAKMLWE